MFKNALVSVSDKTGLVDFLRPYVARGLRVVSTGGTLRHLRENGIAAVEVSEQTGFPEVMDGRVKTLHPRIHMALLARLNSTADRELLVREGLEPFDLVVVNLYPFESARERALANPNQSNPNQSNPNQANQNLANQKRSKHESPNQDLTDQDLSDQDLSDQELIEYIDIGGPSMLRAAAKNHERIAVICQPSDYAWVAEKKQLDAGDRRVLAARVFAHTASYDDLIAKSFLESPVISENHQKMFLPDTLVGRPVAELRYGENPHQSASWYRDPVARGGLHEAKILHGKALSYNNLLDLDAACGAVIEFAAPAAVAVKHNNPCGVGTGGSIEEATARAISADPVSVFGGIIALNRVVDLVTAQRLAQIFLECIIAPEFTPEAIERLKVKKDLRLLEWPQMMDFHSAKQFRSIAGGFLVQTVDRMSDWSESWSILGDRPSPQIKQDLSLAWKICARLKSNAIALVSSGRSVGLGMGQVNRVDAVEQAIGRQRKHHPDVRDVVLASDAFFPFPDSVELAHQAGIRWIIQPGGSIRDEAVFQRASELGVHMVLTGTRHFRH